MALIPVEERVEPTSPVFDVPGYGGRTRPMAYPVNEIVEEIQAAADEAGFSSDPNLFKLFSGYRSDASQQRLFERKVASLQTKYPEMSLSEIHRLARKTVAKPGSSSHRTGYAFDIYLGHKPGYSISNADPANTAYIETTPAYQFMRDIAPQYGLTQLHNEPWHWECDRGCRDSFLNRNQITSGHNGETMVASLSTGKKVGIALLGVSCLSVIGFGAWTLLKNRRS